MKVKAAIFIVCIVAFGCNKDNSVNIALNGTLTTRPDNSVCSCSYFDNADFDFIHGGQPVRGNYRVFFFQSSNNNICGPTIRFYLKTSLSDTYFAINSTQLMRGQAATAYHNINLCSASAFFPEPIGGQIKGKRTDANHWLINATIVFGYNNNPVDTLVVRQYFILQKLP
jgi:hypothetical protein